MGNSFLSNLYAVVSKLNEERASTPAGHILLKKRRALLDPHFVYLTFLTDPDQAQF